MAALKERAHLRPGRRLARAAVHPNKGLPVWAAPRGGQTNAGRNLEHASLAHDPERPGQHETPAYHCLPVMVPRMEAAPGRRESVP